MLLNAQAYSQNIAPSLGGKELKLIEDTSDLILGDLAAGQGDPMNTAIYFERLTRDHPEEKFLIQCFNGALQAQARSLAEKCYARLQKLVNQKLVEPKYLSIPSEDELNQDSPADAEQPETGRSPESLFRQSSPPVSDPQSERKEQMVVLQARMIALTYPEEIAAMKLIAVLQKLAVPKQQAMIGQIARFLSELRLYSRGASLFEALSKHYPDARFKVFQAEFLRQTWQDEKALQISKKAFEQESSPLTLLEYVEALQQHGDIDSALNTLQEYQSYPAFMDVVLKTRMEKISNLRPEPEFRALLESFEKNSQLPNMQSDTLINILLNWFELKEYSHTLKLINDFEKIILPRGENESILMLIYLKGASMLAVNDANGQALINRVRAVPRFAQMERLRVWREKIAKIGLQATVDEMLSMENIIRAPQDFLLQARVLAEFHREADALQILTHGLAFHPNDTGILYEAAMLAIKLEKPALMEKYLLKAIAINPKDYHAHNALGYSWADLGVNLPEAKQHIDFALAYQPLEPVILDSLGWYYYRAGQSQNALEFLRRANHLQHDSEIAAHLIEVLWETAKNTSSPEKARALQDEALSLYAEAMKLSSSHADPELVRRGVGLLERVAQRINLPTAPR